MFLTLATKKNLNMERNYKEYQDRNIRYATFSCIELNS